MHLPRPDIFISATSADLAPMRELVKHAVLDLGAHPIEQQHFAPAGKTVADMLREKIAASHALIHLVGECYGAEDESAPAAREHRTYAEGRRSYTQLEHDLAKELGKPIYIFICGENFPYREHEPEPEEKRALQREHRAQLLGGNVLFHTLERSEDLREHILRLDEPLRLLAEKLRGTGERETLVIQEIQSLRVQNEKLTDLVQAVLARDRAPGNLAAAQIEVARERGLTLEELRARLDDAAASAAERVRLADTIEQIATAARAAAHLAKRTALRDLGNAALANIKYPEAAEHYGLSAALYDRQKEPLLWADAKDALSGALYRDGKFMESAGVYEEVLAERERQLGTEHEQTLTAMNDLAAALIEGGANAAAEPLCQRALEVSERVLSVEHPHTLQSVNNLSLLLFYKGDYAAAELLYRRALAVRERVLGAEHPDTLTSVNNLAGLLWTKGDLAAAEPLLRRALEARERVLGPEHPDTFGSINDLAILLKDKCDYAAAEPLYQRASAGCERVLGTEHPQTLNSVNNFGVMLRDTGQYSEAEPRLRRGLFGMERVLGKEHPATLRSAYHLALLFHKQDNEADAKTLAWRAYCGLSKAVGAEHKWTREARELLIDLGEKVEE